MLKTIKHMKEAKKTKRNGEIYKFKEREKEEGGGERGITKNWFMQL